MLVPFFGIYPKFKFFPKWNQTCETQIHKHTRSLYGNWTYIKLFGILLTMLILEIFSSSLELILFFFTIPLLVGVTTIEDRSVRPAVVDAPLLICWVSFRLLIFLVGDIVALLFRGTSNEEKIIMIIMVRRKLCFANTDGTKIIQYWIIVHLRVWDTYVGT
jgi:hypothetical protein